MLAYTAKTATAHKHYGYKAMTTAQKESFHNAFKRYAIAQFKAAGGTKNFDGSSSGFFSRKIFRVSLADFFRSSEFYNMAVVKKGLINPDFSFSRDDKSKLIRKTKSLIVAGGYKAEIDKEIYILMWKPSRK